MTTENDFSTLLDSSLYDTEVKYREDTSRDSFTRFLFVSLLNSDIQNDADLSVNFHSETFQHFLQKEDILIKIITGCFILTYDSNDSNKAPALLGLLEAPPKVLYKIISKIKQSGMIHSTRVLLASEDCPSREFENFGIFSANTVREANIDILEEGEVNVVDAILRSICDEAKNFPFPNKDAGTFQNIIELAGKQRKAVPTFSRIEACVMSDFFAQIEEFIEIFITPIVCKVEDNLAYPIEPTLRYEYEFKQSD